MKKTAAVLLALAFVLLSAAGIGTRMDARAESIQEAAGEERLFQVEIAPQGTNDLKMEIRFTDRGKELAKQWPCRLELTPENGLVIQEGKTDISLTNELVLSSPGISLTLSYDKSKVTRRTDAGDIIPTLTATLYAAARPVCVYQAEFDATPIARVILVPQNHQGENKAEAPAKRMEKLWEHTYCSGRETEITRWPLNEPLGTVRNMFANFDQDPDRNDLTYIYIATHGNQGIFCLWGSEDRDLAGGPIMYYKNFFQQLSEFEGRYVVVFDTCMSGSAIDAAKKMPASSGMESLDPERFFVLTSMDRTTFSVFGVLAKRIEDHSAVSRLLNTNITCGELYGFLRNGTSQVLKGIFGEAEKPGPTALEIFWGVAKAFSQDCQAYGNFDLPFFIYDQENSDLEDVPLAFLRDAYTVMPDGEIQSLALGRQTSMSDGEGWEHNITIFCVDKKGHLILDASGRQAKYDVYTLNGYVEEPSNFYMRVWLLDHRYVLLELADPSVSPNANDRYAVVYRVLGLDQEGKLTELASARTNGRGGEVYCYSGNERVKTLGSLENDAEALREFFRPYGVDFGRVEQVLSPYHGTGPESASVYYRRAFITDEASAQLVYDSDQWAAYYGLPDRQSIIDKRYRPMEVRVETEDTVHVELNSGSAELADLFLMELKGLLPYLTLTASTRETDLEIWTEEYTTDSGCVLTITADAATGAIRTLRFDDSALYGFERQGKMNMYDPIVWRSSASMQSVVDIVAASEAFSLDQAVRDAIYDTDFAALYTAVEDAVGNQSLKGTVNYDGVAIEIFKRRQVAGMEYMSSYILFSFE